MGLRTPRTRQLVAAALTVGVTLVAAPAVAVTVPSAPRSAVSQAGNGQVTVRWQAPSSWGGAPIDAYRVVHWVAGSTARFVTDVGGSARSKVVTGLTNGTSYRFAVRAHNPAGWSAASGVVSAVPRTTPSAPTGLAATAGDSQVALAWSPPASDGGAPVDGYRLRKSSDGGLTWSPAITSNGTSDVTTTTATVPGLDNGTRYRFQVRAHNTAGWGAFSLRAEATPGYPPDPGFGVLSGPCGRVLPQLDEAASAFLESRLDFGSDAYDDADKPLLTAGSRVILDMPNAGGSSVIAEVFAYELLARCERATLIKTETEIEYDGESSRTDLLVGVSGIKVGVSVTRAMSFPEDEPYPVDSARTLLEQKLAAIRSSSDHVVAADAWVKQVLVVMAYSDVHAASIREAWFAIDTAERGDTVLSLVVTDGSDRPIYFGS